MNRTRTNHRPDASTRSKLRHRLAAGVLACVGLTAGLVEAGTAGATAVNWTTGAAADTMGACVTNSFTGNRLARFYVGQYGFDYSRLYVYDYATGTGAYEQWSPISQGNFDFHRVVGGYKAFYIQYADYVGNNQWVFAGEWVVFGNSYYCG